MIHRQTGRNDFALPDFGISKAIRFADWEDLNAFCIFEQPERINGGQRHVTGRGHVTFQAHGQRLASKPDVANFRVTDQAKAVDEVLHAAACVLVAKAARSFACVSMRGGMPLRMRWIWERLTPAMFASSETPKPVSAIALVSHAGS